jgi:hypothetical protein
MLGDRDAYDVAAVWRYFLEEFKAQFQDTQLTTCARQKVRTLKMQWPHVDQYIRDFKALVRAAKYDTDNPETVDLFIEGLSSSIRKDVFAPPMPTTYRAIKRKAIEATTSSRFLDELAKKEQQRRTNPQGSSWQNFQQEQRGRQQQQRGHPRPPPGQYNSSNAPYSLNSQRYTGTNGYWQRAKLPRPPASIQPSGVPAVQPGSSQSSPDESPAETATRRQPPGLLQLRTTGAFPPQLPVSQASTHRTHAPVAAGR